MGACCDKNGGYSKLDDPEFRTFPALKHNYEESIYCRRYPLQLIEPNKNSWETMRHFKIVFLGEPKVGKTSIISQKVSYKFDLDYSPTIEDYYVKVHRLNVDDININKSIINDEDLNNLNSSLSVNESLSRINSRKGSASFSARYDNNGTNYNNLQCFHCILDIQDTAGSLDFRQNINQWIWRSQVFVIVFDITDRKTFESIENAFISRIIELRKCEQPPIILVGNKSDQVNKSSIINTTKTKTPSSSSSSSVSEINMVKHGGNNENNKESIDLNTKENTRQVSIDMIEELCNKYNIPYIECSAKERLNINYVFDMSVKERLFHEAYWKSETFMLQKNANDMDMY